MREELAGTDAFMCVEVDNSFCLTDLTRRFEEFFPNRTIRLIIDGKYSRYFYKGADKKWLFLKGKDVTFDLTCRVMLDENIYDFVSMEQIQLFSALKIPIGEFKIIRDINLYGREYPGMFFSNGEYHFFDQFLMLDAEPFVNFLANWFSCKTIVNTANYKDCGIIVVKSPIPIFGGKID